MKIAPSLLVGTIIVLAILSAMPYGHGATFQRNYSSGGEFLNVTSMGANVNMILGNLAVISTQCSGSNGVGTMTDNQNDAWSMDASYSAYGWTFSQWSTQAKATNVVAVSMQLAGSSSVCDYTSQVFDAPAMAVTLKAFVSATYVCNTPLTYVCPDIASTYGYPLNTPANSIIVSSLLTDRTLSTVGGYYQGPHAAITPQNPLIGPVKAYASGCITFCSPIPSMVSAYAYQANSQTALGLSWTVDGDGLYVNPNYSVTMNVAVMSVVYVPTGVVTSTSYTTTVITTVISGTTTIFTSTITQTSVSGGGSVDIIAFLLMLFLGVPIYAWLAAAAILILAIALVTTRRH